MTAERVRALVTEAHRTGRRRDTGPPTGELPDTGSHFVTLVKPEVLTTGAATGALGEVVRMLGEGEVTLRRCALMPAADFAGRGYLLLHYPRLHRVAADGARALCSGARRELGSFMETSGTDAAVGAYEALTREPGLVAVALAERCDQAGVHKLGSGSYASLIEVNGRPRTVLNGFLPALVAQYADRSALVGLLECHSHRTIDDLRTGLLGALHPPSAAPGSLRGALAALTARTRRPALSAGRNGAHLSAGHLEGMFQAWRYFAAADGQGLGSTALGRALAERGVPLAAVAELAADPNLTEDSGETVAPHGATENLGRAEVVDQVQRWAVAGKGLAT
ncbi:hypothetical protein ACFQVC_28990 [Streptomyces monticola]|uniref:Uncharacterized protein n=1 Tax=Streptomyces monticola TaxID=2666263 RepID=A0ABW2JQ24_9ACTN